MCDLIPIMLTVERQSPPSDFFLNLLVCHSYNPNAPFMPVDCFILKMQDVGLICHLTCQVQSSIVDIIILELHVLSSDVV